MRDEPYSDMRGASCVFIARPGNNNRLLFITPAPNARNVLHLIAPGSTTRFFTDFLSLYEIVTPTRRGFSKKVKCFWKSYQWAFIINTYKYNIYNEYHTVMADMY